MLVLALLYWFHQLPPAPEEAPGLNPPSPWFAQPPFPAFSSYLCFYLLRFLQIYLLKTIHFCHDLKVESASLSPHYMGLADLPFFVSPLGHLLSIIFLEFALTFFFDLFFNSPSCPPSPNIFPTPASSANKPEGNSCQVHSPICHPP